MDTAKETRVRILQDSDPMDPRAWDNLGTMVCWHRDYKLGDHQPDCDPETFEIPEGAVVLPLYLYDHSGLVMRTAPFHCPWDSGQVGWIYATATRLAKEDLDATDDADRAKAIEILRHEVETYDQFLRGSVWGFVVESLSHCAACGRSEWLEEDSCFGYIGDDLAETGIREAVPAEITDAMLQEAWDTR